MTGSRTRTASRMFRNRTILVVEPDPQITGMLRGALALRAPEIVPVPCRDNALDVLRGRTVHLIVVDMNVSAGVQFCRTIRGCWNVPVIIVSVRGSDKDKVEALDGGADDFIAKPLSIGELIARMRATLRRAAFCDDTTPQGELVRLPCGHYQTPQEILRLAARISVSRRETTSVVVQPVKGRPRKMTVCRICGAAGGILEMRSHKCSAETQEYDRARAAAAGLTGDEPALILPDHRR